MYSASFLYSYSFVKMRMEANVLDVFSHVLLHAKIGIMSRGGKIRFDAHTTKDLCSVGYGYVL